MDALGQYGRAQSNGRTIDHRGTESDLLVRGTGRSGDTSGLHSPNTATTNGRTNALRQWPERTTFVVDAEFRVLGTASQIHAEPVSVSCANTSSSTSLTVRSKLGIASKSGPFVTG